MQGPRKYNRGRWAVERERDHILEYEPPKAFTDAAPLSAPLQGVMKKLGLDIQHRLQELTVKWPDIAGPDVAQHTRPGRLEKGRLTVYVDSSVWLSELSRFGLDVLLRNIRQRYTSGKIDSVSLQLDPDGAPPAETTSKKSWKRRRRSG
jgi:hypothetical protein